MLQKANIEKPFDPSLIDVDIEVVTVGRLLDFLSNGWLDLMPEFQRSDKLWKPWQKSRLVESILLGLPLPSFYFSEFYDEQMGRSRFQVIDGLQRLTALKEFVFDKTFRLIGLQFLKKYENCSWDDLGKVEQMNFSSLRVTINTLRKGTPVYVKYVIFQRVNTAGMPLTPQEMRWALNQGKATKLLKSLAGSSEFLHATSHGVPAKRMEDIDYINRFIAFYLNYEDYANYENLDDFLNVALEMVNEMDADQIRDLESAFYKSMWTCVQIFGRDAFRKRYNVGDRRRRLSKAVYDALSVSVAKLTDAAQQLLIERGELVRQEMINLFHDAQFNNAISTGTGGVKSVNVRFTMVNEMIQNVLNYA